MEKVNLLIVDDELGPREALRMILKNDFSLSFATNGKQAVDHVKQQDVDLVVMDMKMPVMDGMEALRRIKEFNPYMPVLMVTGYGTIDTAVEAMRIGASDYITKPFDAFAILEKLKNAINDSRKNTESQQMIQQIQAASEKLTEQQDSLQKHVIQLSKLSSIGMLAQGIAHNLSSPLLIILGRAELMKEKLVGIRSKLVTLSGNSDSIDKRESLPVFKEYDQSIKDTEIIIENVTKLTDIIRNMMQKSRQDQIQCPQLVNLSEIMFEELKFLEADLFFKHSVEKEYDLCGDLPLIKGVYSDFSQSFLNIIQNAIDAMRSTECRRLTIKTHHDGEFIYVVISDSGCGIPKENLQSIFEPYFTTKSASEDGSRHMGTGLGLHMVKILLEPYGVKIDVKSSPDTTTFTLMVPHSRD
jgi:signal transduction histidine kinase